MSSSKETALIALKRFYLKKTESHPLRDTYRSDYDRLWADATVDELPKHYTIDEYGFDDVIEGEVG
jgi:hypothetical protein